MSTSLRAPRLWTLGALLILCTLAPLPAQAELIERVAARVNDDIITLYDIRQAATPFMLQRGMSPRVLESRAQREALFKEVLNDLIERRLLLQEAKKVELTISDGELDQWLAFTRQQQGLNEEQFRQTIGQYGMSYADYREMVRQNLLRVRITRMKVGSKVSVSDAEVSEIFRARYGNEESNERYITVSHILVQPASTDEADVRQAYKRIMEAKLRVERGEEFAQVASELSDGPSAKKRGELGTYRRGELDPEFEEAAFELEVNKLSEVVRTKFGFHLILVSNIEQRANPDIEDRKDEIRGELQQRAMERQLKAYLHSLKARSLVEVRL